MLIGVDEHHVVVVEETKDQWMRHTEDDQKAPVASSVVAKYLTEALGG
jgi:hypothetical protein